MTSKNAQHAQSGSVQEVMLTFLKLGLTSFGGPVAHLAYFRKELVERRAWVSEGQYAQLLAICQFLPGPASSQLGFALGLLRTGWLGGIGAFVAFTLPSALLMLLFAFALPYMSGGVGESAIHGLKLVACAVVADAVLGMSKKLCPDTQRQTIAVLAACFMLLAESAWSQIFVVLAGALAGIWFCRESFSSDSPLIQVPYSQKTGLALLGLFFGLLLMVMFVTSSSAIIEIAQAFYRAGALVFGGGHVVLPLLQDSVVSTGWVDNETFLAGYGAAQAIPGPMFSFSAYLGYVIPTGNGSLVGAFVALLFMFLPGFLLVAAALPLWQSISNNRRAANAIAGVNAAVVGLLVAALYDPIFTSGVSSGADLAIAMVGFGLLAIWKLSPLYVVVWCLLASVLIH